MTIYYAVCAMALCLLSVTSHSIETAEQAGLRVLVQRLCSAATICYRGIQLSPKITVLPSGTLSQTVEFLNHCVFNCVQLTRQP